MSFRQSLVGDVERLIGRRLTLITQIKGLKISVNLATYGCRNQRSIFLFVLLLLVVGCQGETAPAGSPPTVAALAPTAPIAPLLSRTVEPTQDVPTTPTYTPRSTVAVTVWPTIAPLGTGIRPGDAELFRPLELDPNAPSNDWRPPPLPVPLSIHPDDHYWFIRPIPSGNRNFDLEYYPYGNDVLIPQYYPYRVHHGLDFPNDTGTPILAASDGRVVHAGPLVSTRNGYNYYGNTVVIKHDWQWLGQDVYTLYAHTLELFVTLNQDVQQGQLIAGVGASGEVSGPHLHFEVRVGENTYGHTRNPMLWIAPYEGWGTLAGRVVDRNGRYITNAKVTVTPQTVAGPEREQRTYLTNAVRPDDVWEENFVVGDLPAGRYTVLIDIEGTQYRHSVTVLPGRTNFLTIATNFTFVPTLTPTASSTPTITPVITGTHTISTTLTPESP